MKKTIILSILLILITSPVWAFTTAIQALVGGGTAQQGGGGSYNTIAYVAMGGGTGTSATISNTTTGNTVVGSVHLMNTAGTLTSVSATGATCSVGTTQAAGSGFGLAMWYCINVTGQASHVFTPTVSGTTVYSVYAFEFTNVASYDTISTGSDKTNTGEVTAFTPTNNNEVVVGCTIFNSSGGSAASGFTSRQNGNYMHCANSVQTTKTEVSTLNGASIATGSIALAFVATTQ